jgi:hypothetical protein
VENVLPRGYRFRSAFLWFPAVVAGRKRWMESVRIVQRYDGPTDEDGYDYLNGFNSSWFDVGFWDEVFPTLAKQPAGFEEL